MRYKVIDVHVKTLNIFSIRVLKYQREKGTIYWGVRTLENAVTGGKNDDWVGNCPLVYMVKGPEVTGELVNG